MNRLKTELSLFVNSLYSELDYSIPYELIWKENINNDYLYFCVKSGNSYEINDHDRIVHKIINSKFKDSISEIYTIDTGRYYQIWLCGKGELRAKKIKKMIK